MSRPIIADRKLESEPRHARPCPALSVCSSMSVWANAKVSVLGFSGCYEAHHRLPDLSVSGPRARAHLGALAPLVFFCKVLLRLQCSSARPADHDLKPT